MTWHAFPPIPIRTHDWAAFRDGDEERSDRYGWGRTEDEAIAALLADEEARKIDEAMEMEQS